MSESEVKVEVKWSESKFWVKMKWIWLNEPKNCLLQRVFFVGLAFKICKM